MVNKNYSFTAAYLFATAASSFVSLALSILLLAIGMATLFLYLDIKMVLTQLEQQKISNLNSEAIFVRLLEAQSDKLRSIGELHKKSGRTAKSLKRDRKGVGVGADSGKDEEEAERVEQ